MNDWKHFLFFLVLIFKFPTTFSVASMVTPLNHQHRSLTTSSAHTWYRCCLPSVDIMAWIKALIFYNISETVMDVPASLASLINWKPKKPKRKQTAVHIASLGNFHYVHARVDSFPLVKQKCLMCGFSCIILKSYRILRFYTNSECQNSAYRSFRIEYIVNNTRQETKYRCIWVKSWIKRKELYSSYKRLKHTYFLSFIMSEREHH